MMITITATQPTDQQVSAAVDLVIADARENHGDTGRDLAIVMDARGLGTAEIIDWVTDGTIEPELASAYLLVITADVEQLDRSRGWA
jgi:hypothetical protein